MPVDSDVSPRWQWGDGLCSKWYFVLDLLDRPKSPLFHAQTWRWDLRSGGFAVHFTFRFPSGCLFSLPLVGFCFFSAWLRVNSRAWGSPQMGWRAYSVIRPLRECVWVNCQEVQSLAFSFAKAAFDVGSKVDGAQARKSSRNRGW